MSEHTNVHDTVCRSMRTSIHTLNKAGYVRVYVYDMYTTRSRSELVYTIEHAPTRSGVINVDNRLMFFIVKLECLLL